MLASWLAWLRDSGKDLRVLTKEQRARVEGFERAAGMAPPDGCRIVAQSAARVSARRRKALQLPPPPKQPIPPWLDVRSGQGFTNAPPPIVKIPLRRANVTA